MDFAERDFVATEKKYYSLRKAALQEIAGNNFFKVYPKTNFNLVPLISDNENKVYILTGSQQDGIVYFGNDYLLTFDADNKLLGKKQLHQNIIQIDNNTVPEGAQIEETMHSHAPETGDFITATDICTLMLYEKFTSWKHHNVVSKKYLNIWNCQTNQLVVVPMETVDKINNEGKKNRKKKNGE